MDLERTEKIEIIKDLKNILTCEYDIIEQGERHGTIVFSEKLGGYIRIGQGCHYDFNELAFMRINRTSVYIKDSDNLIGYICADGENQVELREAKLNSKEFEFVNEIIQLGKQKTK